MPAISELLIRIDATTEGLRRELQRADQQLGGFAGRTDKSLTSIDNSFTRLGRGIGGITSALGGLGLAFGGMEIASGFVRLADSATTVQNKLRDVTGSSEELRSAYDQLFRSSQENAVSIESSVDLYARLMRSLERTGMTGEEVAEIVDTLGKAARLSGMSAAESSGAMIQLSQAFQSGVLSGDEFKTMAEAMPSLLDAVAEEMASINGEPFDVVRAALKDMASEGEVSTEVLVAAIQNMRDETVDRFSQIEGTVGDSTTRMWNALTDLVGKFDDVSGASGAVGDKIDGLSSVIGWAAGVIDAYGGSLRALMDILGQIPSPLETMIELAKSGHAELAKLAAYAQQVGGQVAEAGGSIMAGAKQPSPLMKWGMGIGQEYKSEINELIAPTKNALTGGGAGGVNQGVIDWTVSKELQDAWKDFDKRLTARAQGGAAPAPTDAEGGLVIEINKGVTEKKARAPRPWQPPKPKKEDMRAIEALRKETNTAREEYQVKVSELDDLMKQGNLSDNLYRKALAKAEEDYQKAIQPKKKPKTEAEKAAEKRAREIESLRKSTLTPQEEFQEEKSRLEKLKQEGGIDEKLYSRGVEAARKDMESALKPKKGPKSEEEKAQERAEREGQGISREVMTNTEAYSAEIARLDELLARNAITHEEHSRAVEAADIAMQQNQMTFAGSQDAARAYLDEIARLDSMLATGAISQDEYNAKVLGAQEKYAEAKAGSAEYAAEVARLDEALAAGAISQEEHAASLEIARSSMTKGMKEGAALYEEMRNPLERYNDEMERLSDLWAAGAIGDETKMRKAAQLMETLREETIATNTALQQAKALSDDLGMAMAGAFEDAIIEGGKLRDILDSLWQDIQRIVVRQLVTIPLASGISSIIGGALMGGMMPMGAGFAEGGKLDGKGSGTSDSNLAYFSKDEYLVNAKSTKKHLPLLEAINKDKLGQPSIPRFAMGGTVGRISVPHFAAGGLVGSGGPAAESGAIEIKLENKSSQPLKLESSQQRKGPNGGAMISVMITDAVKAALNAGEFDRGMGSRYGASVQPIGR